MNVDDSHHHHSLPFTLVNDGHLSPWTLQVLEENSSRARVLAGLPPGPGSPGRATTAPCPTLGSPGWGHGTVMKTAGVKCDWSTVTIPWVLMLEKKGIKSREFNGFKTRFNRV